MKKSGLRKKANKLIREYGTKYIDGFKYEKGKDFITTKLGNVCGKTGQYFVPNELFQKRTARKNRAMIFWKTVLDNGMTMEQLQTFEGGIVVVFRNNDFFNTTYQKNKLFIELKKRLGSDDTVSSAIFILSESGSSSSAGPREAFGKLVNNTNVEYKGKKIIITEKNYKDFYIKQIKRGRGNTQGNRNWSGFLYISIRGGQQETLESHKGESLTLFNPACEYASEDVAEDLNFIMEYYVLLSFDMDMLKKSNDELYKKLGKLISEFEEELKKTEYNIKGSFSGNLLDYVKSQYSVALYCNQLTDPIQMKKIETRHFNISERKEDSLDLTHEEAVELDKYYWDEKRKCILSPARPTNVFWSFHLSNMMQQNYNLEDYFQMEKSRFVQREKRITQMKEESKKND